MGESGEIERFTPSEKILKVDVVLRAIRDYKPTSSSSSGQSHISKIQKVQPHNRPLENTRSTYTPKIISVGPLHHGEDELKPMEDLKKKYLNKLLNRRGQVTKVELSSDGKNDDELLRKFIEAAIDMENNVRESYELSDTFISSDDFVKMLVIDGCFLLEFLFRRTENFPDRLGNFDETSDDLRRQRPLISHDILLFENQIPFLVLQKFYEILGGRTPDHNTAKLACDYLYSFDKSENNTIFLGSNYDTSICGTDSVSNLLHLYHMILLFRKWTMSSSENGHRNHTQRPPFVDLITRIVRKWTMELFSWLFVIVSSPFYFIHEIFFADITYPTKLISAMEIEEAGVRLQGSRMDLRFEEGTLLVPVLTLNQQSLCLLKNLMAFEFYFRSDRVVVTPYVHKYVSFLSILIKNPADLKVMEKHHIIMSGGGDESFKLVHELIQAGFEELMSGQADEIQSGLKTYCEKPRHRWRAMLMKDYSGNPWSILGVLGGVILLVLTTLQTVFTVKYFYHQ